jgi:hypothetical protein
VPTSEYKKKVKINEHTEVKEISDSDLEYTKEKIYERIQLEPKQKLQSRRHRHREDESDKNIQDNSDLSNSNSNAFKYFKGKPKPKPKPVNRSFDLQTILN